MAIGPRSWFATRSTEQDCHEVPSRLSRCCIPHQPQPQHQATTGSRQHGHKSNAQRYCPFRRGQFQWAGAKAYRLALETPFWSSCSLKLTADAERPSPSPAAGAVTLWLPSSPLRTHDAMSHRDFLRVRAPCHPFSTSQALPFQY